MTVGGVRLSLSVALAAAIHGQIGLRAQDLPPRGREVLTATFSARASTDGSASSASDRQGPAVSSDGQMNLMYRPLVSPVSLQVGF